MLVIKEEGSRAISVRESDAKAERYLLEANVEAGSAVLDRGEVELTTATSRSLDGRGPNLVGLMSVRAFREIYVSRAQVRRGASVVPTRGSEGLADKKHKTYVAGGTAPNLDISYDPKSYSPGAAGSC